MSNASPSLNDAYRDWLGIPAEKHPPDHYTLLGLAPFESDGAKIQKAILERTKVVRSRCLTHRELGTKLLNEIASVGVTLGSPLSKAKYDAALKAKAAVVAPSGTSGAVPAKPTPVAAAPARAVVVDPQDPANHWPLGAPSKQAPLTPKPVPIPAKVVSGQPAIGKATAPSAAAASPTRWHDEPDDLAALASASSFDAIGMWQRVFFGLALVVPLCFATVVFAAWRMSHNAQPAVAAANLPNVPQLPAPAPPQIPDASPAATGDPPPALPDPLPSSVGPAQPDAAPPGSTLEPSSLNPLPPDHSPLDPAVVPPGPGVPPGPVSPPSGNPGEMRRFIGRLVRIECRQDDVRLLLKPDPEPALLPSAGPAPEAFTGILEAVAPKRFENELADYRTVEDAISDRFRSTFGEVSFLSVAASLPAQGFFEQAERDAHLVEVVGSYTSPAEPLKRRLAMNSLETQAPPIASTAVVVVDGVMRVGEPQTLARAGHTRLPDTFSKDIVSNRSYASALLRSTTKALRVQELTGLLFAMDTGEQSLMFIPDGTLLGMNVKPGKERYDGARPADIVDAEFRSGLMRGSQFAKVRGRFRFHGEYDSEGTPCVRALGPLRTEPIADLSAFLGSGTPPGGAGAAAPPPGMSEFPPGVGPGGPGDIPGRVPGTIAGRPGPGAVDVPNPGEVTDNGSGEPFYVIGYSFGGSRTVGVQYKIVQGRDDRDKNISFVEQQGYKVLKPIRSFDDLERAQTYIEAQQNRR